MLKRVVVALVLLAIAVPAWALTTKDKALWDFGGVLDIDGVKAALAKGANPNASVNTGIVRTPLVAVTLGNLFYSADIRQKAGINQDEAKKYANDRAVELTKILFAGGAKLGPHDKGILFFPISFGNVELVSLLIDKGASVRSGLEGYTPTELAKKYGQETIYKLLVSRGGIPVSDISSAQLALIEAAGLNGDVESMERTFKNGARINDFDSAKATALMVAVRGPVINNIRAEVIWWLLDHGADPNLKSKDGLPLNALVFANSDSLNGKRGPILKQLAEETLMRLLKAGAKVSGTDEVGRTALHVAAREDNLRAAEILIKEGAKVMSRDITGKTPLDYAESGAMIMLLKQNGATEH